MITAELIQQTEGRFTERQTVRQGHEAKIHSGALLEADSPDRVRKRVQHLAQMIIETEGVGLPTPGQAQGAGLATLERIMGKSDLMSVRYLELGLRIARTVGRIHVRRADGALQGYGTGFLVSPRLLLTNNHVLTDAGVAATSRIEFDFQEGIDGRLQSSFFLNFDPAAFFATDKMLDFSLVALKGDLRKIAPYGWNGLSAAEGKIIIGEYVSIIQHPSGERKQLALRENQVIDVLDNFLHYRTDTSPGSSGSPVFNDQWEIVALHHSGVPKKDAQGRVLTKDGRVYTPTMSETLIDWIANEGVRISQILRHVQGLNLSGEQVTLRKQLLDSEKGWQAGTAASKELAMTVLEAEPAGESELMDSLAALERSAPQGVAGPVPDSALEWLVGGNNGAGSSWP
ncbi:trypsin-like peptidase domain-containing protein [Microvirga sp. BT689]|uniref:trypsin-like serine peptidase n=1 Tax=Microvirga arvi TaxID=2778731 RepID=UPI00194E8B9E|nr:serine protease [Microvirga arvi]MBM6584214.1 trypsin-like peptidase domain-containing protein [Microvirga arvi]